MNLPDDDLKLIEDAKKIGGFIGNEERFLDIITRQQKALEKAIIQRDDSIDALQESPTTRNINWATWCKDLCNKEIAKLLGGGGE